MKHSEFLRLKAYQRAVRRLPVYRPFPSRRAVKSAASATGQEGLKTFRIQHDVHIERLFLKHP